MIADISIHLKNRLLLFFKITRCVFSTNSIYRSGTAVWIICSLLFAFVKISIWKSLIGSSVVDGVNYSDMITYVALGVLMDTFIYSPSPASISSYFQQRFRTGEIAGDFIRPISFKALVFCNYMGQCLYRVIFISMFVFVTIVLMWGIAKPIGSTAFLLYILIQLVGIYIAYKIQYITSLLIFWFKSDYYLMFSSSLYILFSGSFIPLWFYPDALKTIANLLPYKLIFFDPASIYLGKNSGISQIIISEIIWIILLIIIEKFIWSKAQKVVTIQGG